MSDHLPECIARDGCLECAYGYHEGLCTPCICGDLRACEARVRRGRVSTATLTYQRAYAAGRADEREAHTDYCSRYAAGVAAAREAVKEVCYHDDPGEWCIFLAAIDALKENP